MSISTDALRARRRGSALRLTVFACAGLLALTGCAHADHSGFGHESHSIADHHAHAEDGHHEGGSSHSSHAAPGSDDDPVVREPLPVSVEIPAIGVDADLVGIGLGDDGAMEVPDFGVAGWYTKGPPPGAPGPAVIAAHVDSIDGPDVFYELGTLGAGDEIKVRRDDGSAASFVVEAVEQHPKDDLPGDRIWAASPGPELILITCGGTFDRATGHYLDNVIVYATGAV